MARQFFAAATCSWIDPATGLPEVDDAQITQHEQPRDFLTGKSGFRFANFMEVWVEFGAAPGGGAVTGFTAASGIYRGPSFLRIRSHAFQTLQDQRDEGGSVRFQQTVGARTVSPEVIGNAVGGAVGAVVGNFLVPGAGAFIGKHYGEKIGTSKAHDMKGFPPIWTTLQIVIEKGGRATASLFQHSLFPSMTTYLPPDAQAADAPQSRFVMADHPNGQRFYNATKDAQLPDWQARGWGVKDRSARVGPCGGNPWGIEKENSGPENDTPN